MTVDSDIRFEEKSTRNDSSFARAFLWSKRRESNPRESAWEADAIPLGDSCIAYLLYNISLEKAIKNERKK